MKNSEKNIALERIKLLMRYSTKETYTENLNKINEQETGYTMQLDRQYGDPDWVEKKSQERFKAQQEEIARTYPNYCKYKEKTVIPRKNEYGLKGKDAIVPQCCAYSMPGEGCDSYKKLKKTTLAGTNYSFLEKEKANYEAYILLPISAQTIWFYDSPQDYINSLETLFDNLTPKEQALIDKELVLRQLAELIPRGSVRGFVNGGITYNATVCFSPLIVNKYFEFIGFKGYQNNKGEFYEYPVQKDERTEYQKFIDDWGTVLQITLAVFPPLRAKCNRNKRHLPAP